MYGICHTGSLALNEAVNHLDGLLANIPPEARNEAVQVVQVILNDCTTIRRLDARAAQMRFYMEYRVPLGPIIGFVRGAANERISRALRTQLARPTGTAKAVEEQVPVVAGQQASGQVQIEHTLLPAA